MWRHSWLIRRPSRAPSGRSWRRSPGSFAEEEKRYNAEKKDIETDAKKLEHERDLFRERHPYFEFGEVLLQIAIVSASVSILSTSRQMFWFSLILAVLGAVLTLNGYSRLFTLPFLHHH
mgnify:FL=1